VWCAFPEREDPARPGPGEHIGYVLAVSGVVGPPVAITALVAFTTSQPWTSPTRPPGLFVFDRQAAVALGQGRAFVMDLRRLAAVPVTLEWFPRLDQPGGGVKGHIPKKQQRLYLQVVEDLLTRRPELIERLGPNWPGERR
jgi:hypothetical protein